jgi:uncharacterized Zn finger protein (UPF0148 family)
LFRCYKCGKKIGFIKGFNKANSKGEILCDICALKSLKNEEQFRKEMEEKKKLELQRQQEETEKLLNEKIIEIKKKLENGKDIYMYKSAYIPVDSIILKEVVAATFDISTLQAFGLEGWEVVGVVPRTVGSGLENVSMGRTSGQTWGGGMGGNVVGVHILMKKKINLGENDLELQIRDYILPFIMG